MVDEGNKKTELNLNSFLKRQCTKMLVSHVADTKKLDGISSLQCVLR